MVTTTKVEQVGFKQAAQIGNMSAKGRLNFIAEGLPVIYQSAKSLMDAAAALDAFPREQAVLESHAREECAKLLILVDLVRCPSKRAPARIGWMMKWFYNHLSRLIYVEAQSWRPTSIDELQTYVDGLRPTHYLEGDNSEYIMPSWTTFRRESSLYADVLGNEDADPVWSSPLEGRLDGFHRVPLAWRITDALSAFGLLSREGVEILSTIWGRHHFTSQSCWSETQPLYSAMERACEAAGLPQVSVTEAHVSTLYSDWQMPMYEIDFTPKSVTLEELRKQREQALWNEVI